MQSVIYIVVPDPARLVAIPLSREPQALVQPPFRRSGKLSGGWNPGFMMPAGRRGEEPDEGSKATEEW